MVKPVIGVIAATILMFLWGFLFWTLSPLPDTAFMQTADDRLAGESLLAHFPVSGTYFIPGTYNDVETMNALMRSGPIAHVHIRREGAEPMSLLTMLLGLMHMLFSVILIALLLSMVRPVLRSYGTSVIFVAMAGLTAAFFANMGNPIWWHHDWSWSWLVFVYQVIDWLLTGLVLSAFIKPRPGSVGV
jgi:hypothetical protein